MRAIAALSDSNTSKGSWLCHIALCQLISVHYSMLPFLAMSQRQHAAKFWSITSNMFSAGGSSSTSKQLCLPQFSSTSRFLPIFDPFYLSLTLIQLNRGFGWFVDAKSVCVCE